MCRRILKRGIQCGRRQGGKRERAGPDALSRAGVNRHPECRKLTKET